MSKLTRRQSLKVLAASAAAASCSKPSSRIEEPTMMTQASAGSAARRAGEAVEAVEPLGFPWKTRDPFLFCVYHLDHYPEGNPQLGPKGSLAGRRLGNDFVVKDGFRMYHGRSVPGFPQHPHRGFETVTVVRQGLVDHSDSLGASGRYGRGDVQWMTAGKGILHAEMFPLVESGRNNPLELFQIWLNLPAEKKMVEPHFKMLWAPQLPAIEERDGAGHRTRIGLVAGGYGGKRPPAPPPNSWASGVGSDVAIWTLSLDPGAKWTLPAAPAGVNRTLYFYRGSGLHIGDREIPADRLVELQGDVALPLWAGADGAELLLLQGRPIGEPVATRGPFVMNTAAEIQQAYADYQRTGFGGWPWPDDAPVHPRKQGRYARHADGKEERPG